jgi:hypothetical protein
MGALETVGTVTISPRQAALIGGELRAFVADMPIGDVRAGYEALAADLGTGQVEGASLARLELFLEIALQSGRVRDRHGLHGEDEVRRLFGKTPRGAAQAASAGEVSEALASLVGQTIKELRLTTNRPGSYRLILETDQARISLALVPAGAHVESIELNL